MTNRLFVGVLGNRNSGKSSTWNSLFNGTQRTGKRTRKLKLLDDIYVDVFLISGSPEERNLYAKDILENVDCKIILCSMQYIETVRETLNFVVDNGFDFFVQWLNPGYKDIGTSFDELGLYTWMAGNGATTSIRDGKADPKIRAQEIRDYVTGWAMSRGLTYESE